MYRVLVGGISPEGEHLLTAYLEKFMRDDFQIEPLKAAGIKGRMRNHAPRQDVLLVILDDLLWDACVGVVDSSLQLPKVHKYESDDGLREFLASKFGPLDDLDAPGVVPPDVLMAADEPEDDYIPKRADFAKDEARGETIPPDALEVEEEEPFVPEPAPAVDETVLVDDELPTTDETDEIAATDAPSEVVAKLNTQIRDLRSQLNGKESLIRSLTLQLNDKTASDQDDISALIGRIRELESIIEDYKSQLGDSDEANRVNLGKIDNAERVLGEVEELRAQTKKAVEARERVERERDVLAGKLEAAEAELAGLREQVSQLNDIRRELAAKTKEVGRLELDVQSKVALISELESANSGNAGVATELAQLQSEMGVLQHQIEEDKERLKRLDEAEDELSAKQLEIGNLRADLGAVNEKLQAQENDEAQLRADLKVKVDELAEAKQALAACREELKQRTAELEECQKAREVAESEVLASSGYSQSLAQSTETLGKRITELTDDLSKKSVQAEELMSRLTAAESEVEDLTQQLTTSEKNLGEKTAECEKLSEQLEATQQALSDKNNECLAISRQFHEYEDMTSAGLHSLQDQLADSKAEVEDLSGRVKAKDGTISTLTTEITGLHEQLAAKDGEITQIHNQLAGVRQQLLEAQSERETAQASADTQKSALDKLIAEKQALEDKLVATESKRMELETRIKTLESDLQQEREYRGSVDESNVELSAQNDKLANHIKQLEENLVRAKADEATVSRLETELLDERRKSARLQSEVDVLKRTGDSDKASDLRIEVARLKGELTQLRNSTVDATEVDSLRMDLQDSRERVAELELALVDKDAQVDAISSSVFAQLRNIAIPKGAYDFHFGALEGLSNKFICVASGSEESTANVYQVLRSACTASNKRVIIVDLVTDSSIDREFGIKKVVSPIGWLTGEEAFRGYISDTRFGHVKVLSTALAYINDLFLLTVDWQNRLLELDAFSSDIVILYVGCLNNLVTKVLFDMFSRAMTSYVVVKATPVNLRTTILNLTGFKDLSSNVTVECVNFSDTSSAAMYQRLVAKYKAQVLRDNDVLPL